MRIGLPRSEVFPEVLPEGQKSAIDIGTLSVLECAPFERVAPGLWGALGVVVVEVLDRKAGVLDVVADGPREVAPAHQPFVQRLEPLLPTRDVGVGGVAVLDKVERATRLEDSPNLGPSAVTRSGIVQSVHVDNTASNCADSKSRC